MKQILILTLFSFLNSGTFATDLYTVKINSGLTIKDAPVAIDLSEIPAEKRANINVFIGKNEITSQLDDLNRDGIIDEVSFMTDIEKGKELTVFMHLNRSQKIAGTESEIFTSLILKSPNGEQNQVLEASSGMNNMYNKLHHHGVAFESEKIAYRIYFDNKSTIDIYGKKKNRLELPETFWYPTDEQLKSGYGDDILLVKDLVGNGSLKGWDGSRAMHIDKFDQRTQRILAKGPVRAVVESDVKGWEYEGKKVDATIRYTLYARHRDVKAEFFCNQDLNAIATGVQEVGGGELLKSNCLIGSWGSWYPQPDTLKYHKETVGLGLFMPAKYFGKQASDRANNLIIASCSQNKVLCYYFTTVYASEQGQKIQNASSFFDYLEIWKNETEAIQIGKINFWAK